MVRLISFTKFLAICDKCGATKEGETSISNFGNMFQRRTYSIPKNWKFENEAPSLDGMDYVDDYAPLTERKTYCLECVEKLKQLEIYR